MTRSPKISIIHFEPELSGYSGHLYNTLETIKKAFLSHGHEYRVVTAPQAQSIDNGFLQCEFNFDEMPKYRNTFFGNLFLNPIIYNYKIFKGIISTKIYADNVIYFNTCQHLHLIGIAIACLFKRPNYIVLTFRLDTFSGYRSIPRVAWYFVGIQLIRLLFNSKTKFVTDSDLLVERFKNIYNLDLKKLPIPHIPNIEETRNTKQLVTIGSLGPASRPKNVLSTIDALHSIDQKLTHKINYLLYSYGECEKQINSKLKKLSFYNISFIVKDKPVPYSEYLSDLQSVDIVMTNYIETYYRYNTSGIFSEAYALNKIIVTSPDTWMSANSNNCPGVLVLKNQQDVGRTLIYALSNFEKIKRSISRAYKVDNFYEEFMSLME
ncbi:hypothetical protein NHB35_01810 [Polynucleobacter sp. MWH-UH23A]